MKITIEYESSWRNSFLEGSNNDVLPKTGRKFIGSLKSLNERSKPENFIRREVTIDTVMGVLNRLIGDQRKLYQSRNSENYFFKEIESLVRFDDKPKSVNAEMTYIRNITGSTDQNAFTGMIKVNDPIFTSDYAEYFWGVLSLDMPDLISFILGKEVSFNFISVEPLSLIARLEEINKQKPIEKEGELAEAYQYLSDKFEKFKGINNKGLVLPISMYCSALYLQIERLSDKYDMSSAKTKAGGIGGISNNGFTKKDFMGRYTTGEKKKIWGNPYMREELVKGIGKTRHLMTKASGQLVIEIDIPRERAKELSQLIENAGVSSFYLGKKGLAYVSNIRI
ncbi:type I-Fv CRISPR-associated protein Cas5fv [Vibrio sp. CK2-1]|uniref:type I-Fv CRISPR-associated protein Cas5fv n=1 Tax=Vibrio sp. CK2-1 TaxID=2912249 RepID=UPI001F28B422|nr:type I-Fv CRISPR-associated protein Cas5fv [Vibrio sp. CK2-1]MCF7353215.1 type I-Fv CRISPR-associated protein Cas5fv [Vibrio sp. CK2-1]